MTSYVSVELRRIVAVRANFLCEYCLIHEADTYLGCQVDHIIAEKHGGPTADENLCYACAFCNRAKGTDIATISRSSGDLTRLFHPRTDRWSDHFALNGWTIEAKTFVGEATIQLLGLNQRDRLLERETLNKIGRYPTSEARAHLI